MDKITIAYTGYSIEDFRYNPCTYTIILPESLGPKTSFFGLLSSKKHFTRLDLYSVLHELGHAAHKHEDFSNDTVILQQEIEAWEYAFSCIKEEYKEECREIAKYYIEGYS